MEMANGTSYQMKDVKNRLLVNALLDLLASGEAETITLTVEEKADYVVMGCWLTGLSIGCRDGPVVETRLCWLEYGP